MAFMKPGGSAHHLVRKGLTPPERVTKAKLHLPGLEESAGSLPAPADVSSPGLGSFCSPIICLPTCLCPLRPLAGPGDEVKIAVEQVLWG